MTLLYKERVDTAANDDSVFRAKQLAATQDWLRDAIYPPIASEIEEAIDALRNKQPEYEPLLFDLYVGEAAAALDRCLALRREIQELEATALSFARNYERAERTKEIDKALDDSMAQAVSSEQLGTDFKKAATKFTDQKINGLADGLKEQSNALGVAHTATSADLKDRAEKIRRRWSIVDAMDAAEQAQHSTPGHALNFGERRKRLVNLLRLDLTEALKKMIAVKEGIKVIYGDADIPKLPEPSDENALDQMLYWVRSTIEWLEKLREKEVEFDIVVPMVQKSYNRNWEEISVGSTAEAFQKDKDGQFNATKFGDWIGQVFGETNDKRVRVKYLRLAAVGASISTSNTDESNQRTAIWNVVVFPPATDRSLDKSLSKHVIRPPIILGNVRYHGIESNVAMDSGVAVRNQKVAGEWRVKVLPHVATAFADARGRESLSAVDLKLHLRVVGVPLNDPAGW